MLLGGENTDNYGKRNEKEGEIKQEFGQEQLILTLALAQTLAYEGVSLRAGLFAPSPHSAALRSGLSAAIPHASRTLAVLNTHTVAVCVRD
jgi:hypothetical protein